MKNTALLILLMMPFLVSAQKWQVAEMLMSDGSLIQGEVRLRENIGFRELKFRAGPSSRWIDLSNIKSGKINQRDFKVLHLTEEEGQPYALAWPMQTRDWYFSLFQERECLCNNSYKHTKAYIAEHQGRFIVLRKKGFRDRIKNPESIKILFPEISENILRFSEIPELLSKSSGN